MSLWTGWKIKPPPGTPIDPTNGLCQNLVAFWAFSESSGGAINSSGPIALPGVFYTGTASPTWVGGIFGPAVSFTSANSQGISVASHPSFIFGAGKPFTQAAWVYVPSLPGAWSDIFNQGRTANPT
jgi:hypothetical protein